MRSSHLICLIFFVCLSSFTYSQSDSLDQEIKNLITFAKLYGKVRYFYPGDDAADMDWNKFSIAAVEEIRMIKKDQTQFLPTLKKFFSPIAPGMIIEENEEFSDFDLSTITPDNPEEFIPIYWQHRGVGNGSPVNLYQSIRINRKLAPIKNRNGELVEFPESLFKIDLEVGETIKADLGQNIKAIIPLVLYGNTEYTFPQTDLRAVIELSEKINKAAFPYNQGNQLPVRMASIIITWNVFQHFYPYFDLLDLDWEKELYHTLHATYEDRSFVDFRIRLEKMTEKLNDGHIRVSVFGDDSESGTPRFAWEWAEGQLIITRILDENYSQVKIGESVIEIDGQKPKEYFDAKMERISSSTPGWKQYRAQISSLLGEYMGFFSLKVKGLDGIIREEKIKRDMRMKDFFIRFHKGSLSKELKPDIWYLNLSQTSWPEIDSLLPQLKKAKGIICDLRGYPAGNHQLISHFLSKKDTSSQWMQIPLITRPDFQQVTWHKSGWNLKPQKPRLSAPVYFLTDGRAISYAESYMSLIKHYNLATIIGQPTAGTNGNVNWLVLPGGYRISWTGMRVRKHDGTELSGSGILPDIPLERTIEGIIQQRDEFLERALQEIEKN